MLDTHIVLWWLDESDALTSRARDAIADADNEVIVSVVSLWEMATKIRIGKLRVDLAAAKAALEHQAVTMLGITRAHLATLIALPLHHRDPFDHLLIAQAISSNALLVTGDRQMAQYPVRIFA